MKKLKNLVSLVLCALLVFSLAACGQGFGGGGGRGGNVTYGRYVEEDITPPDLVGNLINFYYDESGVMDIITLEYDDEWIEQGYQRYRSEDNGKSWTSLDMAWADKYITDTSDLEADEQPDVQTYLNRVEILGDGSLIVTISTYDNITYMNSNEIMSVSPDGTVSPVDIPVLAELADIKGDSYINTLQMLDDTRIILDVQVYEMMSYSGGGMAMSAGDGGNISGIFDINTGEQLVDFSKIDSWDKFFGDGVMYAEGENGFAAYSLEDGQKLEAELPDPDLFWKNNIYPSSSNSCVGPNHTFYGINTKGLVMIGPGMEDAELLMDGLNYSYGSPMCWVNNLYINGEEILMTVEDNIEGALLLRYVWDDKAPATSDKHLSVYSLYDNDGVRLALSEFRKQNPEVSLSYESALTRDYYGEEENSGMTSEDALRALSTELLAGNGPDVLILDDLPLQSYIDKGILEDLSDVVAGANVFNSVIDPLRSGDSLYAVPGHFSMPVLFGQKGKLDEFDSFESLIKQVEESSAGMGAWPDWDSMTDEEWDEYYEERNRPLQYDERPVFQIENLDELVSIFYETSAPAMYTEATGLDKDALREYLRAVKTVSDHYGLTENEYLTENAADSYVISMGGTSHSYSASLDYYGSHRAKVGYAQMDSAYNIVNLAWSEHWSGVDYEYNEETDTYEEVPKEGFTRQNSDVTPAPGLAKNVYFPRNLAGVCSTSNEKELAKEFIATMISYDVQKYNWYSNGMPVNIEAFDTIWEESFTTNKWQEEQGFVLTEIPIKPLIESFETPYFTNEYLLKTIYQHTVPFCQGKMDLDATVKAIVDETEIYFAERQ